MTILTNAPTYVGVPALDAALNMRPAPGKRTEFHTHTGSVYTITAGRIMGGKLRDRAVRYAKISPEAYILDVPFEASVITWKLEVTDENGHRIVLTSPITKVVITFI